MKNAKWILAVKSSLGILLFSALSSCSGQNYAIEEAVGQCFGSDCGSCTRTAGHIGFIKDASDTPKDKALSAYIDEDGNLLNEIPKVTFGNFAPHDPSFLLNSGFVLRNSRSFPISRKNGKEVRNYFMLSFLTSFLLPNEDHAYAKFFRDALEDLEIQIAVINEGATQISNYGDDSVRSVITSYDNPVSPGPVLKCFPSTVRLSSTIPYNLDIKWALADGNPDKPPRGALSFFLTTPGNTAAMALCDQKLWGAEDPRRPAAPSEGLGQEVLAPAGWIVIPEYMFQVTAESIRKNPNLLRCPTPETPAGT